MAEHNEKYLKRYDEITAQLEKLGAEKADRISKSKVIKSVSKQGEYLTALSQSVLYQYANE